MDHGEYGPITSAAGLFAADEAIDLSICGISLATPGATAYRQSGAHDPTPTPYFILEELFEQFAFGESAHLLDVGCGKGRALAHFLRKGYPGRATGIELDPELAATARGWAARHANLDVLEGSILDADLSGYTDFYLFNPFDASVLMRFIEKMEAEVQHPVTVVHMSDNGDTWWYMGRPGWQEMASGEFQGFVNADGCAVTVYAAPQHWTAWRFGPSRA